MSSTDCSCVEERPKTTSRFSELEDDSMFYKEVLQNPEQYPQSVVEEALNEDLRH